LLLCGKILRYAQVAFTPFLHEKGTESFEENASALREFHKNRSWLEPEKKCKSSKVRIVGTIFYRV
jgi:hypothetical protein